MQELTKAITAEFAKVLRQLAEKSSSERYPCISEARIGIPGVDTGRLATAAIAGYEAYDGEMRNVSDSAQRRIGSSEGRMQERDTIPKPVGLGVQLQNQKTNSYRTGSNAVQECSRPV
jgi:hypothetical protein